MKKIITLIFSLYLTIDATAQIFHKKYAYSGEIMQGVTSVVNNNRIYIASSSTMLPGMFTIQKTDLAGNLVIARSIFYGTSIPTVKVNKMITSGDRLYIVGSLQQTSQSDGLVLALDTNLTTIYYTKSFGTNTGVEVFNDVILASNNDLIMVGNSTVPTGTVSVTKAVPFIVRAAAATGTVVYQKIYEDASNKYLFSVTEDVVNNTLFASGTIQGSNGTHIMKLTNDNLGNILTAKNMIFASNTMNVKKLQVYGNKLFLVGGDNNNNLTTVETDLSVNALVMPKFYSNFKYQDMIKVNKTNYIAGLTVPTGTVSYLAALRMDSLFVPQGAATYTLVQVPVASWSAANVVNKSNTMYWITNESWTAPNPYTNRYIVASDMALNATCNGSYSLTPGNIVHTMVTATFTTPVSSFTVINHNPFPNAMTPTITTLCSSTGIENVNENFEKFIIKNGTEQVIIVSPYNEYTIELVDMSGKVAFVKNSTSANEEIALGNLSSGIYVIKLSAQGYEQRQKLIKQ